jgi:hypothetical protein
VSFLRIPTPPRLPDPETDSPRSFTALLYVLRLYFAQLDGVMQALLGRNGGQFLEVPSASYNNPSDQATLAGTALAVRIPDFTHEQGFTKPTVSKIQPDHAGTYYMQCTLNFINSGGSDRLVSAWLRKSGVDVPTSRVDSTIPSNDINSLSIAYLGDLLPTDTLEVMMLSPNVAAFLYAAPAIGALPTGASVRLNIHYVSNDSTVQTTSLLHRVKKRTDGHSEEFP